MASVLRLKFGFIFREESVVRGPSAGAGCAGGPGKPAVGSMAAEATGKCVGLQAQDPRNGSGPPLEERPLLLVCSSGGHLLQLVGLREAFEGFPRLWVTFDKPDAQSLLADERVVHAHGPTNRNIPNLLRNLRLARRLLAHERPRAIVSTGAGVAVPFAWLGRLMGIPVVYVESVTRIASLSLSGRMIAPVASDVFVQWPELADSVRGARYAGSNLAAA